MTALRSSLLGHQSSGCGCTLGLLIVVQVLALIQVCPVSAQVGADEPSPDVSTWAEIRVTSLFTLITATTFLAIYEFGRRNPAVSEVFDRRRASNPHRTPPPLMKNRRIFEWMFLSTSPAYTEYARKFQLKVEKKEKRKSKELKQTALRRALKDRFHRQKQVPVYRQKFSNKQQQQQANKKKTPSISMTQQDRDKIIAEEDPPIPPSGSSTSPSKSRKRAAALLKNGKTNNDHATAAAAAIIGSLQQPTHQHGKDLTLPNGSASSTPFPSAGNSVSSSDRNKRSSVNRADNSVIFSSSSEDEEDNDDRFSNSSRSSSASESPSASDASSISSSDSPLRRSKQQHHQGPGEWGNNKPHHRRSNTTATHRSNLLRHVPPPLDGKNDSRGGRAGPQHHSLSPHHNHHQSMPHSPTSPPPVPVVTVNQYQIPMGLAEQVITGHVPPTQMQLLEEEAKEMMRKQRARHLAAKKIQEGFRRAAQHQTNATTPPKTKNSKRLSIPKYQQHHQEGGRTVTKRSTLIDEYDYDHAVPKAPKVFTRSPPRRERSQAPLPSAHDVAGDGDAGSSNASSIFTATDPNSTKSQDGDQQQPSSTSQLPAPEGSLPNVSGAFNPSLLHRDSSNTNAGSVSSVEKQSLLGEKNAAKKPNRRRIMHHLTSAEQVNKRPLDICDQELLRCVGLDTFVMLRFLRFGLDVALYPFIFGCLILIPTYYTNDYDGTVDTPTDGYFRITMQRLEYNSPRHWICIVFAMTFYGFVLRRLWIEWETFISLRFDFLANGDTDVTGRDALHLDQYRTSCMVESVPETHRRDRELFEFFDSLFPGQVERAEILLNASHLTKLIKERKHNIVMYENTYAQHFHDREVYRKKMEQQGKVNVSFARYLCCGSCGLPPHKPEDPKISVARSSDGVKCTGRLRDHISMCCGKRMVKALPHYLSETKRLNHEIDKEHKRIHQEKMKSDKKDNPTSTFIVSNLQAGAMMLVSGTKSDLNSDTGFVQFKTLTAKQSAIQCNIVGTDNYMMTSSSPDPRDLIWENSIIEKKTISVRMLQLDAFFLTGTLFWSAVISGINLFSDLGFLSEILPAWLVPDPDSFMAGLVSGYLPILILEGIMLLLLVVLNFVSRNYIHFKTNSDVDQFVFRWHFGYRLANLFIIIVSGSLIETIQAVRTSPQAVLENLASGIASQSQFFLNNIIVAAGSESAWELAQMPTMILHFLLHKIITVEAKSQRYLEKLEEAENFNFGEIIPQFLFVFMISVVYVIQVPIVPGACALFFFIANKVYTHQALFVYAQAYEGGGKIMYRLNRTILVTLYVGIIVFFTLLGLKGMPIASPLFLFTTFPATLFVDRKIQKTFVIPSDTLALTKARAIDEENRRKELKRQRHLNAEKEEERKLQEAYSFKRENNGFAGSTTGAVSTAATSLFSGGDGTINTGFASNSGGTKVVSSGDSATFAGEPVNNSSTQFHVVREETTEAIKERLKRKLGSADQASKFGKTSLHQIFSSGEEDDEEQDYFLYRQPDLNKSTWETKPLAYR